MLELVSVLMKTLILEGVLLVGLLAVCIVLLGKQLKEKQVSKNIFKEAVSEFKHGVSSGTEYSKIYKSVIVVFGITELTAMWCFTLLFSVMITSNIFVITGMLILEMLLIAVEINNRFATSEESKVTVKWALVRIEKLIKNFSPNFSIKQFYEGTSEESEVN